MALSPVAIQSIMKDDVIKFLLELTSTYTHSLGTLTTSCVLMANLAVEDGNEKIMCDMGALQLLLNCITRHSVKNMSTGSFLHNSMAAISNLSFSKNFVSLMLRHRGVEVLTNVRDSVYRGEEGIPQLLQVSLSKMGLSNTVDTHTTTMHMCAKHGDTSIVSTLLHDSIEVEHINSMDSEQKTPLSYALEAKNFATAQLLILGGADTRAVSPGVLVAQSVQTRQLLHSTNIRYQASQDKLKTLLNELSPLSINCCSLVVRFCNSYKLYVNMFS